MCIYMMCIWCMCIYIIYIYKYLYTKAARKRVPCFSFLYYLLLCIVYPKNKRYCHCLAYKEQTQIC